MHKRRNPFRLYVCMAILLGCTFFSPATYAQNASLRPEAFLPHRLGEQFTAHHQLVSYFEHLAQHNAETMLLERYGLTNEERPLQTAIFSSKENMQNLEKIRLAHLGTAGFGGKIMAKMDKPIAIVWLSMSVHGNEPSGSECSLELAYRLAVQEDPEIKKWLENTVVILDPSLNPDGYSRYTHWYRSVSAKYPTANAEAREHDEPWPGGRVNHYYFDLNRDWAWATQVESQQRLAVYQKWLPHVHADLHEQYVNNPYYFAPAAEPMHHYITPFQREFQSTIGKNHAGYFDENGWLYFTREIFDLFYPSYGDTYPMFNGAIGMTYEQAGHGTAGRAIEMANGDTLRLNDRILHHLTTSLSTIETASREAAGLEKAFSYYFDNASDNPPGNYTSFIIKKENNKDAIAQFLTLLDYHHIQYGSGVSQRNLSGFDYKTGETSNFSIESDDIVINAHQPQAVLLQVLLEPESKLSDTLTYDITAWSLPMAYGLEAFATKENIRSTGDFSLKKEITQVKNDKKDSQIYAWCVRPEGLNSAKFTAQMLQKGYTMRYAKTGFRNLETEFPQGTLVLTKADNKFLWDGIIKDIVQNTEECTLNAHAIHSSWTNQGPNFGSESFEILEYKEIAVLYDDKVDPGSYGFIWHFLENDLHIPFVALSMDKVLSINASVYSTLILPEGSYTFSEDAVKHLANFVKSGGKIIGSGTAVKALGDENPFGVEIKAEEENKTKKLPNYLNKERSSISSSLPGAVVKLNVDKSHPLAADIGETYLSLKTSALTFKMPEKADAVAWIPMDYMHFGFIGSEIQPLLKNTATIISKQMGKGKAVFFADDPLFRGFWYKGKVLFANALFY